MKTDTPIIKISRNKSLNDYLGIIFKLGKYHDTIIIRYMDNYTELVDGLLYGLRKSFGWLKESEIEQVEDENEKCIFFDDGIISSPGEPTKRGTDYGKCKCNESTYSMCTFHVRKMCKYYKQKDRTKFIVNQVVIQKHGALRGL